MAPQAWTSGAWLNRSGASTSAALPVDLGGGRGGWEGEVAVPERGPPVAAKPAADLHRPQPALEQHAVVRGAEIHPVGAAGLVLAHDHAGVVGEEAQAGNVDAP